jgi:hypothetical protein
MGPMIDFLGTFSPAQGFRLFLKTKYFFTTFYGLMHGFNPWGLHIFYTGRAARFEPELVKLASLKKLILILIYFQINNYCIWCLLEAFHSVLKFKGKQSQFICIESRLCRSFLKVKRQMYHTKRYSKFSTLFAMMLTLAICHRCRTPFNNHSIMSLLSSGLVMK